MGWHRPSRSPVAIRRHAVTDVQAYAMTEASHQMTSNPLPKHGPHKPGTVGRAQGSVKVITLSTSTCVSDSSGHCLGMVSAGALMLH